MVGRPIRDAAGNVVGIACSREAVKYCSAGCGRKASKLCDFELVGKRTGETCDAPLCDRCATAITKKKDYCPAHARMAKGAP
jgi:hypothetical protein